MRTRTVSGWLVLGLLAPALTFGQTKEIQDEVDAKLAEEREKDRQAADKVLAEVLTNNPDIRVAAAKVAEAQAELERTRLNVLAQAATLQAQLRAQDRKLASMKPQRELFERLKGKGYTSDAEAMAMEVTLLQAEAERESLAQQLQALRGEVKGAGINFRVQPLLDDATLRLRAQGCPAFVHTANLETVSCANCHTNPHAPVIDAALATMGARRPVVEAEPGSMTDRILRALDKPISAGEDDNLGIPLQEALSFLREKAGGDIPFRYINPKSAGSAPEVTLLGGELPLGARLMHLQDSHPELSVVIRPYGILVTTAPPTSAMFLHDVWPRRKEPAKADE